MSGPLDRMRDKAKLNPRVFFDIKIGAKPVGRLVMELFSDTTPRTSENFRCLCTGEKGLGVKTKQKLHFKNTIFHRIIPGFMAQGGDFQRRDGTGGESIYGGEFRDENFIRKHLGPGLLSMANAGPHTNGSQFFITFGSAPHLNGKHVVFGRVIEGMEILKQIEKVRTNKDDKPQPDVTIVESGEIKQAEPEAATPASAKAAAARRAEDSDDEATHELPASSTAGGAAAAAKSTTATPATLYPVSKGNAASDLVASVLHDATKEEQALKKQLADAEAKAKANGKELSARERKMLELKMKMSVGRRANAQGVAEESKKFELEKAAASSESSGSDGKKQLSNAEFKERQRLWEESEKAKGVDPAMAYLNETADSAEYRGAQKKGKEAAKNKSFGWEVFNQDAQFNAYNKRLNYLPTGTVGVDASGPSSSSSAPSSAAAAGAGVDLHKASLTYGQSAPANKAGIDRMVAELEEGQKRKEKFSRRRPFNEDEDVSYINERNRVFNKKANRAFEAYTLEIQQNIERGTAL